MIAVTFFSNGNTFVNKDGEQVPKLQRSWLELYVSFLIEQNIDPTKVNFFMPDNTLARITSKIGEDEVTEYSWKIVK